MKDRLKGIPIIGKIFEIKRLFRFFNEYCHDFNFFVKNYMFSSTNQYNTAYRILWVCHSLEKGMSNKKLRPFGKKKIIELINLIELSISKEFKNLFEVDLAMSILKQYCILYENNNWNTYEEYVLAKNYIKDKKYNSLKCGVEKYKYIYDGDKTYTQLKEIIENRHSIREYSSKKIELSEITKAIDIAKLAPSACNRQMVKVYFYDDKKSVDYISHVAQGIGGFELENIKFSVITYDTCSLTDVGEKSQGYFNAGLFAMNYVNALHSLGIGSCFIQFSNSFKEEKKIKKVLKIKPNEKIVVFLAMGHYKKSSNITISSRKNNEDILEYESDNNDM